jgi:hypothetical protein
LDHHSGAVQAGASLALTVITIVYVSITGKLLREATEARLAAGRPELAVFVKLWEGGVNFLILCIQNAGPGPALNIRLSKDWGFKERDMIIALDQVGLFTQGVRYLAPGETREHFLVNLAGNLEELKQQALLISATYGDRSGIEHHRVFTIDFGEWENMSRIGGAPPIYTLAEEVKELKRDIGQLVSGSNKPHVIVESYDQYKRREQAEHISWKLERLPAEDQAEIEQWIDGKLPPKG